ncbi:MAG TPA: G8 domain-containing protein, partial [Albitalea sp.]|nr:G8 domain-containing protein [Albitalea sp.]
MIAACGGGSGGGGNSATTVALAGAGGTDSAAAAEAPASAPAPADVTAEPGVLSVAQAEAVREAQAATETLTVTALQSNVGADGTPFASSTPLPATPQAAASSDGGPAVSGVLRWSDRKTWGGELPGAGAQVVVPAGKTILLDIATPSLGALSIEGTLRFDDRNVALTASSINVTGTLEIGTVTAPFVNKATITLTGPQMPTNDGVSRGIIVSGGRLELHGTSPSPVWTKLNEHAEAGAKTLSLADPTSYWRAGDIIAVAPTDYYGVAQTERLTLTDASGKTLTTSQGLAAFRWGKLQYMTSQGMSLTPEAGYTPPVTPAPTVLDERAEVGNLSRNIVIQGADDDAWRMYGFGAHLMIMDLKSKVTVDGVEFRRVGQAGQMARYPIHWHLLSYAPDGSFIGDTVGHSIQNSAIWNS